MCHDQDRIKGFWGLGLFGSQGPILSPSVLDLLKYVTYIPVLNTFKKQIFWTYFARTKL